MNQLYWWRKAINRGVFVFFMGRVCVKLFIPRASRMRVLEAAGNSAAAVDGFWCSFVHPMKSLPFILYSTRGEGVLEGSLLVSRVETFLRLKLDEYLALAAEQAAINLIDFSAFKDICAELGVDVSQQIKGDLGGLCLPVCGGHGDLHLGNFITIDDELKIIDWAMYKSRSMYLLDFMHFYIRRQCCSLGVSWVDVVFNDVPGLELVSDFYLFDMRKLFVLYSVDRILREVAQKGSLSLKDSIKYRKFLEGFRDKWKAC